MPSLAGEEVSLGRGRCERGCTVVGVGGLGRPVQAAQQVRPGGVERVVAVEIEAVDQRERYVRAVDLAHRDGSVQRDDWRRRDGEKLVVERDDLRPVGRLDRVGVGVHRIYGRLNLVRAGPVAAQAGTHDRLAFVDHRPVPSAAVLMTKEDEGTVGSESGAAPGLGQDQQGQQAGNLGLVGHERGEQPGEPDRLAAQHIAGVLPARRAVRPRVVDQVDDGQDGA